MPLATLKSRLNQLRRKRAGVRWGTAWSALALGVLWMLALVFLVDWTLEMTRAQRFVSLLLFLGVSAWVFHRYTRPWLGVREDEVDMALLVERQQHIDSDLVAALQFVRPEARRWGSQQLETAVISYVDDFSPNLNVFEGFSTRRLKRRAGLVTVTLLVLGLGIVLFPSHAAAFFNRFLLGSAHYPTKTRIESVAINGHPVSALTGSEPLKSAYGRPLAFEVVCGGELPDLATVRLRGVDGNAAIELELAAVDTAETGGRRTYRGELPRLVDSVNWQIDAGDAWTDPRRIDVIPLPVVTPVLTLAPPRYAVADSSSREDSQTGALQKAVLEGTRVELGLSCSNKDLKSAVLTIEGNNYPLASAGGPRDWTLDVAGTPLARVASPLRYRLQVEDLDGLGLEKPIDGYIRIRADRIPRVAAAMVSRRVLPTARPTITFGATDDYGISKIVAHLQIVRHDGEMQTETRDVKVVEAAQQPQTVVRGDYVVDLSSLGLSKGDEIKVTLEAFDYRGDLESKSSVSEPLVFQVTDREGIIASLLESDEKSARQLDASIQRELGIGESK